MSSGMPSWSSRNSGRLLSSSRMTTFSPSITPVVATRMSTLRPSISMLIWPSWARRRSTMFMFARILMRLDDGRAHRGRQIEHVVQRAVDAEAHPDPFGLRLDVDVGGPVAQRLGDDLLDDLDDRRVLVDAGDLRLCVAPRRALACCASKAWIWVPTPVSAR